MRSKGGSQSIAAGFAIKLKQGAAAPVTRMQRLSVAWDSVELPPWPVVITPKNQDESLEKVIRWEELEEHAKVQFDTAKYRNAQIAHTVLHEVIEVGLVERYIGSKDRRWFCDGLANYIAWKIMKDLAGEAFATEGYHLNTQLAQYTELHKKISLRKWPAVEHEDLKEKDAILTRAHYAYATRAIALAAEQQGPTFLAEWLKQIGKTDRAKVNHATIEKAYAKLTGRKLSALLREAESSPISKVAAAK